jgi:gluconolactonase
MNKTLLAIVLFLLVCPLCSAQDMPLDLVLIPGETWKPLLKKQFQPEISGISADQAGNAYVVARGGNEITRIATDGVTTALKVSDPVTSLAFDRNNYLYATSPQSGKIFRIGMDGKTETIEGLEKGIEFLAIAGNGTIYGSIPEKNRIVVLTRDGKTKNSIESPLKPSALLLWAKDETLVVGQGTGKHLMAYRIDKEGLPVDGDRYYPLRVQTGKGANTNGLTIDRDQRIYASTALGVQIFDPIGRMCGVVPQPLGSQPVGVTFAGADRSLLLLAAGDQVYSLKTRTSARGANPGKP